VLGRIQNFGFTLQYLWINIHKNFRVYIVLINSVIIKSFANILSSIDEQRNYAVVIIIIIVVTAVMLISWIVVVVAVLCLAVGRFTFSILVSILKDIADAVNIFNWLSCPQLGIICLPIVKGGWP
jgi:hypothetical protein